MRAVTEARRDLIVEVSFVVVGSANAIRGILVDNVGLAVGGLILLALVVATLAFGPVAWRLLPRFLRRPWSKWMRRVFLACFLSYVVVDVINCITSTTRHDWGSTLFYAVKLPADSGLLFGVATSSTRPLGAKPRQETVAAVLARSARQRHDRDSLRPPRP
jgi:hypothetical protein